jgi:transcription elongation GreA/GreB family factor
MPVQAFAARPAISSSDEAVLRPVVVSVGSSVVLEDLDDGSREQYVLVPPAESNPAERRLSDESPVGKAISGRRRGDIVDVHAPHRIRHLRIAELEAGPWPLPATSGYGPFRLSSSQNL